MPLCVVFSQYIVASISIKLPSPRSRIFSTQTATPWGISLSINCKIFSLIISETITRSGWSVKASSWKKCPSQVATFFSSLSKTSSPSWALAEIGTTAAKLISSEICEICFIKTDLSCKTSILFMAKITGNFKFFNFLINFNSEAFKFLPASTTKRQLSTDKIEFFIDFSI